MSTISGVPYALFVPGRYSLFPQRTRDGAGPISRGEGAQEHSTLVYGTKVFVWDLRAIFTFFTTHSPTRPPPSPKKGRSNAQKFL